MLLRLTPAVKLYLRSRSCDLGQSALSSGSSRENAFFSQIHGQKDSECLEILQRIKADKEPERPFRKKFICNPRRPLYYCQKLSIEIESKRKGNL